MTTRREFLQATAAFGVAAGASLPSVGEAKTPNVLSARESNSVIVPSTRIRSACRMEDTVRRYGGNGDNWHMSWAADDRQYLSLCDGTGFSGQSKVQYNSRMLAIDGTPLDARFQDLEGYPMLARPSQREHDTRYYGYGTLALGTHLYQFMSTFNVPLRYSEFKSNPNYLLRFNGVKLIYSPDMGRTWRNRDGSAPVRWETWEERSRETLTFFNEDQEAFSLLSVLQMGKGYKHNRDGYVYVYAPNGNTEGTMNELVMFRVARTEILDRSTYEFFGGIDRGAAKWIRDIDARKPVHTFPRGWVNKQFHPLAWQPSVVYNAGLGLYMMANWGMGTVDGNWFAKPSYLGLWIAEKPWGPWTQIHEELAWLPAQDANARAYQPQIAPKWIAPDGRSFWLVWTDFQGARNENIIEFGEDFSKRADADENTETDVERNATLMRRHMPFYSFNAQRVDLVLG